MVILRIDIDNFLAVFVVKAARNLSMLITSWGIVVGQMDWLIRRQKGININFL